MQEFGWQRVELKYGTDIDVAEEGVFLELLDPSQCNRFNNSEQNHRSNARTHDTDNCQVIKHTSSTVV